MTEQDAISRAADVASRGLGGRRLGRTNARVERSARDDPDARVRAAALGALVRAGSARRARRAWRRAVDDPEAAVRRRAAELAPTGRSGRHAARSLERLLTDDEVTVVEAAAWALGELGRPGVDRDAVHRLADVAQRHDDPLAREAAVAALGALGDPAGLPAVLAGCRDRPAIRRRAVLALAPFEGPDVDAALEAALTDRDWQVRQAAEDLRRE